MKHMTILGIFALFLLLLLPGAVSAADVTVSGSVVDEDLTVTAISPNVGVGAAFFANEPNVISVTVTNNGGLDAAASTVEVVVGTDTYTAAVGALAAGASETVTVTDTVSRTYASGPVSVTATADSADVIVESDEGNNGMTSDLAIYYNGYKGKRFTDGSDIVTYETFELRGDMLYSTGDSVYFSGSSTPWTTYTTTWTAGDLPVPTTATVEEVRLYVYYTWDKVDGIGDVSLSFNSESQTLAATYSDTKSFGSSDYPCGVLVYDVISDFNTAGNTAILTNSNPVAGNPSLKGMVLVVVYEDGSESLKQIIVNEEYDMLASVSSYSTTSEEATAYAPFGDLDTSSVSSATLITVAPGGNGPEGTLIFNAQIWTDVWSYIGATNLAIDERDVTSYLQATDNVVAFQSDVNEYLEGSIAILVLEKTEAAPVVTFTGTPLSGTDPLTVTFDATNTGGLVSSWSWEYSADSGSTWTEFATVEDPTHSFNEGVYDIRVTATGTGGLTDTATESSYISVGEATITITVSPESIDFGNMAAGETVSDSTGVTVTVDGGTAWSVTASATNGGYMMDDTTPLANLLQLSNDGTNFQDMDLDFSDFLTGSAGSGDDGTAYAQQLIDAADAPGAYSITLTFTGGFV